jgi:hypothetical protein
VAVQYNDPDPLRWMALYGAACVVAVMVAVRGTVALAAPIVLGTIALVWSAYWASTSAAALRIYAHMFDGWEMKNAPVEEARETSGLLIVALWMAIVAFRAWAEKPSTGGESLWRR